ncbi:phosphoadenylyl-sulfate reductase [Rhodovibrionaceae bacterium A322]
MSVYPLPFPNVEALATASVRAFEFELRHGDRSGREQLEKAILEDFQGRIALVSSFGAESAVLLHLVAQIDPKTPVVFLDTGRLFGETKRYRDQLVEHLGLRDVRSIQPSAGRLAELDKDEFLFTKNPDLCCQIRKVEPLEAALAGFDAWITGRKAFQTSDRARLPIVETAGSRVKINPLVGWSRVDLATYFETHDLPAHPLEADGFLSIGCMPCTDRVAPGADLRSGRWSGAAKTECGIHSIIGGGHAG